MLQQRDGESANGRKRCTRKHRRIKGPEVGDAGDTELDFAKRVPRGSEENVFETSHFIAVVVVVAFTSYSARQG